ncbi:lysine--tRNA ligase [Candidatus Nitrosacidococcus sp. I8]|uniref:lysine--tRNA ligase n=1 Tax=Candidatus Nitrosacidococcus sp. I8 TaxID=2942908 RepID=UPI0022276EFF|nr:lysine--tRNA ligase [Candidatus Nitrosacidococcus sp. I8]CAH9017423.1 Lysine--tRNA ligase, heat inducible [Candidatus Nitrosacidococcus sp. I8]
MSEQEESTLIAQRRAKLTEIRNQGNPFPNDFRRNTTAKELYEKYDSKDAETLAVDSIKIKISGRMMTRRVMGQASFAHIQDMSGKIQIYARKDSLSENIYQEFKQWDLGDIIGAEGILMKTKSGELSIRVEHLQLLTKSLRPLPEKFHGLTNQEIRYRQRYLDLIMNESTREVFQRRSHIISYIRNYLTHHGFLEVETPMMQNTPGGALARPFVTFHNALDLELFLRIAPELYLKRLVVGGFEKVFELNRNFRNEGLSTRHNPEFTMVEFYQAYASYEDLMDFTESMLKGLTQTVLGSTQITYQGESYNFSKPFNRMTLKESILHFNPQLNTEDIESLDNAQKVAKFLDISTQKSYGLGKIQLEIFEKTVESKLKEPTFITAYPTEVSPLARRNSADPFITDRFEFFVGGWEIANGFSELNDAEDQAGRFQDQLKDREAGDQEAMRFDEDYIRALEYGMPPTAGEGIGIDRLVMLLTDSPSIRDVLLFPHMRPH